MFPITRPRRLRRTAALREMVRETRLHPSNFIYPLFVRSGRGVKDEIRSMPGQFHFSPDTIVDEAGSAWEDGVRAVLLFGLPDQKDELGSEAWDDAGAVQTAVRELKRAHPDLLVLTDVCLCEYTSHGHCGVVHDGRVQNDPTLELLAKAALSHARAGADLVAPSDMMDGRVAAIRAALDGDGHDDVAILSYAAKYASAFYGPFREAADSAPSFGDRRGYQMDPANVREALRECELDVAEGADVIMVKPALPYLDVIRAARDRFDVPLAAYNVSGEYAMVKAAAARGWLDEQTAALESLTAIKRAGADFIVSYWTKELAEWL